LRTLEGVLQILFHLKNIFRKCGSLKVL
jgi:hypothetical protein